MPEVRTLHKHVMSKIGVSKSPLYDVKMIDGKRNDILIGFDIFKFKICADCGFKEPIGVERTIA